MEDNHDLNALDWLIDEIDDSLQQSRKSLEAFVDEPQDNTRLRFCLTHLHQVHGSLKMMELGSACLLAEEMEELCQNLLDGKLAADKLVLDTLMRSLIMLPQFLQQMRLSDSFHSALVFPLVNELRAAQGSSLLIDSLAFKPNLQALSQTLGKPPKISAQPQQFAEICKKLQKMFQFAAANALRGVNVEDNRDYINKAFMRLKAISQGSNAFHLWDIAKAWLDTLSNDDLAQGLAVKALMRHLHRELKRLGSAGPEHLQQPPGTELVRTLLFYLACSDSELETVQAIKARFNLPMAFGDGVDIHASNANQINAVQSVSQVIKEELEQIKQVLAQLEQDLGLGDDIKQAPQVYRRVADTMSVMGIPALPQQLIDQGEKLQQAISSDSISDELIIELAQQLIEVEQKLDIIAATGNVEAELDESAMTAIRIDDAQRAVVAQALPALDQVKQNIVEYITSQWQLKFLQDTPALLREIAGGIGIIPLARSAKILATAAAYIEQKLLMGEAGVPQWLELDTLADAISSVEYYLERLRGNAEEVDDQLLDIAEESLAGLGYSVNKDYLAPEPEPEPEPAVETIELDSSAEAKLSAAEESNQELEIEANDDEIDEEIREIFIEEAAEVIAAIDIHFPRWAANFEDIEALTEFRRAFHTLKGSGRVVRAEQVSELAWSVESLLNQVLERSLAADIAQIELIKQVRVLLPDLMSEYEHRRPPQYRQTQEKLQSWAEQLAAGETPTALLLDIEAERAATQLASLEADAEAQAQAESELSEELQEQYQLWDIFVNEAKGHIATALKFIDQCQAQIPIFQAPNDAMQRALHTLKGSAHMAGVTPLAEMATPLEGLAKEMRNYQVPMNEDSLALFSDACEYMSVGLTQISARQDIDIPEREMFLARVAEQYELNVGHLISSDNGLPANSADPSMLLDFMSTGADLLLDADRLLVSWRSGGPELDLARLQTELNALSAAARSAKLPQIYQLSEILEQIHSRLCAESDLNEDQFWQLETAHEKILDGLDAVAATQELAEPEPALLEQLHKLAEELELNGLEPAPTVVPETETEAETEPEPTRATIQHDRSSEQVLERLVAAPVQNYIADIVSEDDDELDPEILAIFEEEATEQLESIEELIHSWEAQPAKSEYADELNRVLHTLKGGARLSGLMDIGDLAHEFETYIEAHQRDIKPESFAELHDYQDRLMGLLKQIREQDTPTVLAVADALVQASIEQNQVQAMPMTPVALETTAKPEPATILAAQRSAPQELVKVPAELLEELVNLAGETSIARGRMEQQVTDWGMSLEEMNSTILRLQEQLRRLDIETEAQVLFRQEQMQQLDDFDPLEMDRYSQLQQLSRSLAESASDLMDLKTTLSEKTRDTETLLLQQSRINTDLQEGLMRSRMVPFSRMVPRLRRIVRQVAAELNKQIDLEMDNVEGELDRSVLERMLNPLEHMLRNAVDHGIESAEQRSAAGKPEVGRIALSLAREGGDVILRLADDGGGIDLEKVKQRAIAQGLMNADAQLSDKDLLQFVLHSGLSTAESVTQISGRGVGLDVVASEIKQLGGSLSINTVFGQGTEFIIRLPFTVSVNRALMVNIDDDSYAIPLNTIEGIVRVSPFELEHYYQDPQSRFEYAGENYKVRYMGEMLNTGAQPKLEDQILPLPVVLVRTQEHVVAIQVDSLAGSREIVVKSLGQQFAGVQGLSGATVTGDGSVVIIIDPIALIRRQEALNYMPQPQTQASAKLASEEPLVMVVDDSVTVRKVTSRLLEREGYRVITAKDGVEAMHLLQQDELPSIMLLDIEMPRMDGFEVAKNVRSSRRLQQLPIIMITSRTGAKHQEHAKELGVDKYMGKPYQEDALLQNITELMAAVPQQQLG